MNEQNDKELLALFKNPETTKQGFNKIVHTYNKRLYWHVRKIVICHDDANDIIQNTFIKAWKYLPNFREDSQLYTWLYRIATNESLLFLKKKKKHLFQSIDTVSHQLESQIDGNYFSGSEIEKKLQRAILTLPTKQRLVFNMKYFDELKYNEISEILGTSVGALKANYHHAKQKIEKYLTTN